MFNFDNVLFVKKMKRLTWLFVFCLSINLPLKAQIIAYTQDSIKVLLKEDGTWKYEDSLNGVEALNDDNLNQCRGITKANVRCKRVLSGGEMFCYQHKGQIENNNKKILENNSNSQSINRSNLVQCSGTTKKGSRCKRKTKYPNGKCYQHGGK